MKLQKQSIRKIDISQINITNNIRKSYTDIAQLARSIERDGQLQPIGVTQQENGTYNMLYGFRRLHAFKFLLNEGKDFNQIEAKITTGDPGIIQLIENIHRKNLTPEEFENALQTFIDSGMTQKQIAERLNIRLTKVSDTLAARKVRVDAKEKGIDTSGMSTSTLSNLRSVPDEKKKEVIEKVKKKGGTVNAVKEVLGVKKTKKIEQSLLRAKNEKIILPDEMGQVETTIDGKMKFNEKTNTLSEMDTIHRTHRKGQEHTVKEIIIDPRTKEGQKKIKEMQEKNSKFDFVSSDIDEDGESVTIKADIVIEDEIDKPFTQISIKDFLQFPEVKAIIDREKYIVQSKCEYCGKDF